MILPCDFQLFTNNCLNQDAVKKKVSCSRSSECSACYALARPFIRSRLGKVREKLEIFSNFLPAFQHSLVMDDFRIILERRHMTFRATLRAPSRS